MNRLITIIFGFIALIAPVLVTAQGGSSSSSNRGEALFIPPMAVAKLPTNAKAGWIRTVTDGADASDCTIGLGSNNHPCFYNGSAWVVIGSAGGSPAFSVITGGTNTTAAMVVGTGGSLTISGGGTINATTLNTYFKITGPSSTVKTFTFPNADSTVTVTVANGTAALGTGAISSGACATVVSVSATGTATTDTIAFTPNADPTSVTGYGVSATGAVLTVYAYPTADNVNFKVCNSTNASITPSALTLNWKVTR